MNTKRKPTNIMVTIIDTDKLIPALIKFCEEKDSSVIGGRIGCTPIGFVETKEGIYAFNNEGVGPTETINNNNTFDVEFYAEYATEKEGVRSFSAFPNAVQTLNTDDLKALATDKKINLADFIRSFGARLERNYDMWRIALEKAGDKDLTF